MSDYEPILRPVDTVGDKMREALIRLPYSVGGQRAIDQGEDVAWSWAWMMCEQSTEDQWMCDLVEQIGLHLRLKAWNHYITPNSETKVLVEEGDRRLVIQWEDMDVTHNSIYVGLYEQVERTDERYVDHVITGRDHNVVIGAITALLNN